jgi:hypothetical protein
MRGWELLATVRAHVCPFLRSVKVTGFGLNRCAVGPEASGRCHLWAGKVPSWDNPRRARRRGEPADRGAAEGESPRVALAQVTKEDAKVAPLGWKVPLQPHGAAAELPADNRAWDAVAASGGREVKHTGDGIMASFVSAAAAVRCATRIQRALAQYEREHREDPIKVRIGAAAGEPVEHQHDLFGATVQLAARLCSHAQPEQILVSNVVAELCLGKSLPFKDLGEVFLKGFNRPIRVYAVEWPTTDQTS